MYGIAVIFTFPNMQDPKVERIEVYPSLDKAITRANDLLAEFLEEYGEDYSEKATISKSTAYGYNGEVAWWAIIKEIT